MPSSCCPTVVPSRLYAPKVLWLPINSSTSVAKCVCYDSPSPSTQIPVYPFMVLPILTINPTCAGRNPNTVQLWYSAPDPCASDARYIFVIILSCVISGLNGFLSHCHHLRDIFHPSAAKWRGTMTNEKQKRVRRWPHAASLPRDMHSIYSNARGRAYGSNSLPIGSTHVTVTNRCNVLMFTAPRGCTVSGGKSVVPLPGS